MAIETKILLPTAVVQSRVALQDLLSHPQTLPPPHTPSAPRPLTIIQSHAVTFDTFQIAPASVAGAYMEEHQG